MSKHEAGTLRALGLMSGTSMDGIDVAMLETDGAYEIARGHAATYPYSYEFRRELKSAQADAASMTPRDQRPGRLRLLEQYLTQLHAEAVTHYLVDHSIEPATIDVIGFHGHTVLHRPERHLTVQLGDAALLARETGIDVVHDLRAADVAAGGQGAPLVPVYHMALAAKQRRPVAVVNLGGVANVTWVPGGPLDAGSLIAFDTGPGNALIDDWMESHKGRPFDADGACAAEGQVDREILAALLADPYFGEPPPKSLDRNAFARDLVAGLGVADGAATLTAFTAGAIGKARFHMPELPQLWIAVGGGRKNKTLMAAIAGEVEGPVVPAEALGLDGDAIEAEAWAYLAARSLKCLPITFPGTTGVRSPLTGGLLAKAPR